MIESVRILDDRDCVTYLQVHYRAFICSIRIKRRDPLLLPVGEGVGGRKGGRGGEGMDGEGSHQETTITIATLMTTTTTTTTSETTTSRTASLQRRFGIETAVCVDRGIPSSQSRAFYRQPRCDR